MIKLTVVNWKDNSDKRVAGSVNVGGSMPLGLISLCCYLIV